MAAADRLPASPKALDQIEIVLNLHHAANLSFFASISPDSPPLNISTIELKTVGSSK